MSNRSSHAVIDFPDGLPGFEGCRQYVLLSGPAVAPFTIIQGLGPEAPAFAAIDPAQVVDGYRAQLEDADRVRLGATDDAPLVWLALVSPQQEPAPTVNLRAPLVINPQTLRGIQLIAAESPYPLDHPLRTA
jgi:flagellar assembly factor FliW